MCALSFARSAAVTITGPYTYVGLILGVFTGFMSSVVRWGKSVAFISILFARLDYAIYPELFASADTAHSGFVSVVNVDKLYED